MNYKKSWKKLRKYIKKNLDHMVDKNIKNLSSTSMTRIAKINILYKILYKMDEIEEKQNLVK